MAKFQPMNADSMCCDRAVVQVSDLKQRKMCCPHLIDSEWVCSLGDSRFPGVTNGCLQWTEYRSAMIQHHDTTRKRFKRQKGRNSADANVAPDASESNQNHATTNGQRKVNNVDMLALSGFVYERRLVSIAEALLKSSSLRQFIGTAKYWVARETKSELLGQLEHSSLSYDDVDNVPNGYCGYQSLIRFVLWYSECIYDGYNGWDIVPQKKYHIEVLSHQLSKHLFDLTKEYTIKMFSAETKTQVRADKVIWFYPGTNQHAEDIATQFFSKDDYINDDSYFSESHMVLINHISDGYFGFRTFSDTDAECYDCCVPGKVCFYMRNDGGLHWRSWMPKVRASIDYQSTNSLTQHSCRRVTRSGRQLANK